MKKIFSVLFILALVSSSVSALTQINIYVDDIGDALFLGESDALFLQLPKGISYEDGKIRGYTSDLTGKAGDLWIFSYSLLDAEMNIILPEGSKITNIDNGEVYLNNKGIAVYAKENVSFSYIIEETTTPFLERLAVPLIVAGVIFFLIIVIFFFNYFRKEKIILAKLETKDKIESVRGVLNERERLIVDKLKETGKVKSSYLRKLCEIPKASFSRHIQELEKKGLIKRTGESKNKLIELS